LEIQKNEESEPFWAEVDTDVFGDYLDFVSKPMDLGLISHRASVGYYGEDESGFIADVHLVFANCRAYSPEAEPIHQVANTLQAAFDDFMGVDVDV
jgi:hypothetical protein